MNTSKTGGLTGTDGKRLQKANSDNITSAIGADKLDLLSIGILNSLSAHIAVLDANGDIIAINDAWKKFAVDNGGDHPFVNVGSNYFRACLQATDALHQADAAMALEGIKQVLNGDLPEFEMEYPCHSPDEHRWFLMRATPLRFIGSKAVVAHINISAKRRAEESLRQRKQELSALNIIGRTVSSSISLETVTQAILGQIWETIDPDLALLFLREGQDLVLKGMGANKTPYNFDNQHIHKVGHCLCGLAASTGKSIISIDINHDERCSWQECKKAGLTSFAAIPLQKRDEIIGTLGIASIKRRDFGERRQFLETIANDVSIYLDNAILYEKVKKYARDLENQLVERKKMEALLRQTQKMEAIGTLAGGIAHDFNNILSPILGYAELILNDLPEGASIQADLKEIYTAAHRARTLVRQILTFTRQTESELRPIDISLPVKEALSLLRSTTPSTITIVEKIAPALAPVLGDATQVHQIVMNLCTNAAHAMENSGGTLEVNMEQVYWDSKYIVNYKVLPKGYYIKLSVSDTGEGMPSDVMESIFDPYFTTKSSSKGTGLGLAVVHGIIKSHKGEINVYSEPGKGSVFTIYFPVVEKKIESRPEEIRKLPRGHETILYVDDDISVVKMGRHFLERLGYTVETATRSPKALQMFAREPQRFGAVITDMTMPDMRGDQLAARMMEIRPDIPVIVCTGFSRHMSRTTVSKLGIRTVLMKPFTQGDLAVAVRKAIDTIPSAPD